MTLQSVARSRKPLSYPAAGCPVDLSSFALALSLAQSTASSSFLSTWLCLQVYSPLPRASVHADSTWCNVWVPPHSAHFTSCVTFQRARLSPVGSWSYIALIMKLRRRGAILQISSHDRDLCSASSHVVHWPCWCCWTACSTRFYMPDLVEYKVFLHTV